MDEKDMAQALTGSREERVAAIKKLLLIAWKRGWDESTAHWLAMLSEQREKQTAVRA